MQTKRRTRVKGCPGIYRSISGSYEIAYRDSDGRQVFKTMPKPVKGDVRGALEAAKLERADAISRLGRGETERRAPQRFGEYARQVLADLDRAPRTIEKHEYHLASHLDRFRSTQMKDIRVDQVAALVSQMKKKGYVGWTISATLSTLSIVMDKAVRAGYAPVNPVRQLHRDERPKIRHADKRALDQEEIASLLANATDTFRPLIAFMIFTGVRLGESLGVQWSEIDFAAETVRVRAQLDRKRRRVDLKTDAARRDIVLMPDLARILRELKVRSPHSRDTDFVFANPDGRGRDHRSTSRGIFRTVTRAKLRSGVSAHTFRHSFASMLIVGLRYDAVAVSRQLGHTRPSFTMDFYSHLFDKAQHADELRKQLDQQYGHLLADVNTVSSDGSNEPQDEPAPVAAIAHISG